MCESFCASAWLCACQAPDHDLESSSTRKKMSALICAPPTTDHDHASVIPDKKKNSVITVFLQYLLFFEETSPVTNFVTGWYVIRQDP